jgi:3-oxoadipate enol-lactonase
MPEVSVNGTRLYYEDHGSPERPALVFGHSLFFDHTMFRHQVERFSADYRVVVYDHRGQGRSAAAPVEELDMDTLAADAAALIEALELAPRGIMVLLAEQNAGAALKIAHRGYVMENGVITVQGSKDELLGNNEVQRAYMGV